LHFAYHFKPFKSLLLSLSCNESFDSNDDINFFFVKFIYTIDVFVRQERPEFKKAFSGMKKISL
jgi:hypothetical protein